jgi:Histidine kinase-, DNA gyrase B-, and HSP90-like ATPase
MLVRERWTSQHDIAAVDATLGQVPADEQKVRQVIVNLLSDAIKFTPEVGRIEVGSAEAGTVEVSMSDTRVGITTEDQEADLQARATCSRSGRTRDARPGAAARARPSDRRCSRCATPPARCSQCGSDWSVFSTLESQYHVTVEFRQVNRFGEEGEGPVGERLFLRLRERTP